MTYNLLDKDYVFIPGGENQQAVSNLITNLREKTITLQNTYRDKIKNIQDTIYNHQNDDNKLQTMFDKQKDLENQENIKFYRDYQEKQNAKIEELSRQSNELQKNLYTPDFFAEQTYGTIKSVLGQHLSLIKVPDTKLIRNKNSYMININQSCLFYDTDLFYDPKKGKDKNKEIFSLRKCDSNSYNQNFQLTPIYDIESYYLNFRKYPTPETIKQFPFNLVKPNISSGTKCITDNNGTGISLDDCDKSLEGQKWIGLKNTPQKCFTN